METSFKAGFVSILGKPNVGKSTLMNQLIGEKLSITTPKPQTTRQTIRGIHTTDDYQIVFLDTPGLVKARYELHERMLFYIENAMKDSDAVLFITDAVDYPTEYDLEMIGKLKSVKRPKIAVLNKMDLVTEEVVAQKINALKDYVDEVIPVSALENKNTDFLLQRIYDFLPYHPAYYNDGELSDMPLRFFAQEIIREKIYLAYQQEIPYCSSVKVDEYSENDDRVFIRATIFLERPSQKPILLGKNGEKIRVVREQAEFEIAALVGKRTILNMWIKIKPNWRKSNTALNEFGYRKD